ncbi:MAG: O-antigen ligase family protein [Cellvibrionaceae bacterium]
MIRGDGLNFPQISIIVYYALSPFLYLVRTLVGDFGFSAIILRSLEPCLILVVFLSLLNLQKIKINIIIVSMILLGIYGIVVGFLNENKPVDVVSGMSHFYMGVLLCAYFYSVDTLSNMNRFMMLLSFYCIISISIVLFVMYTLPYWAGIQIYLGLACQILIIIFFYNVHQKKITISILTLLLILASGKRGVLVALFIAFAASFFPFFVKYHSKEMLKITSIIIIAASFVFFFNAPVLDKFLSKFSINNTSTLNSYSSGRINEISSAFNFFYNTNNNILLGKGFGFSYTYVNDDKNIPDVEGYRNIHFSYLNPLLIFGLPLAFFYYCILLLVFFKVSNFGLRGSIYLKWSVFSYFVYACFVFNLFNEPILWMCIGIVFRAKNFLARSVPVNE